MSGLQVDGLIAGYGTLQALHGVEVSVARGEKVALIGPNGAGKSTLLKCISGLLKPKAGSVTFEGARIDAMAPHEIPRLGLVQVPEARHIFSDLTVEENLLVGGTVQRNAAARRDTLAEIMDLLPALRAKLPLPAGSLSGGQQQMLAIGRAMMARPAMVILDEPSLGLAPIIVQEIFEIFDRLATMGTTVLLVEQDVYLALQFAERAYVLESGNIVLSGPAKTLLADDHVRRSYLGI